MQKEYSESIMFVATYFYSNTGHSKAVTNSFRSKNLKEFQETYSVFAYVFGQVVLYGIKSAVFTICYGFSKWKPHVFVCLAFFSRYCLHKEFKSEEMRSTHCLFLEYSKGDLPKSILSS